MSGKCMRIHLVYPYCIFKAKINYKNIAPGKPWTQGPLFRDDSGCFYILEKIDGGYAMRYIHTSPVYMAANFYSGRREMIFEGDIISLTTVDKNSSSDFDTPDDIIRRMQGTNQTEQTEREIFDSVPLNKRITSRLSGIVCFYNSIAYLQYMNYNDGTLCYTPLYPYFQQNDLLPAEGVVAEVLGNVTDNPELIDEIFSMQLKTGYTHSNT